MMVRDQEIITRFGATQACYIGFLAGVAFEKEMSTTHKKNKKKLFQHKNQSPLLRLVYTQHK